MKKLFTAILVAALCPMAAMAQKAVTNVTTGEEYEAFKDAFNAAKSGDVLRINQNINTIDIFNPKEREITIEGANENITISSTPRVVFQVNSTGSLTLNNLTIDLGGEATTANVIQQSAGTLSVSNVTIKGFNFTYTKTPGAIRIHSDAVKTVLENFKIENPSYSEGNEVDVLNSVANPDFTLIGECNYIVKLNNAAAYITDGGIADGSLTTITYGSHTATVPVVKNCTDFEKFNLNVSNKLLAPTGNDLYAIDYSPVLLINDTENGKESKVYKALTGSSNGIKADDFAANSLVIINENVNYTASLDMKGKNVTIKGRTPDVTINRTNNRTIANAATDNTTQANTNITLEDLIITETPADSWPNDNGGISSLAVANGANNSVTLRNVTVKDCKNTTNPFITSRNSGTWHIDGVSFDNCEVQGNTCFATVNFNGCTISGKNNYLNVRVNNFATATQAAPSRAEDGAVTIDCAGLEKGETTVDIFVGNINEKVDKQTLIKNCADPKLFYLLNNNYELRPDDDGGLMVFNTIINGVEDVVVDADCPAEYFDLRGCRVDADALTPGMYICRRGATVTKVAVR